MDALNQLQRLCLAVLVLSAAATTQIGAQAVTEFPIPTASSHPFAITAGPDGNLWFAEHIGSKIGRLTTAGVITEFPTPTAASGPNGIAAGPDGNLWFAEALAGNIGRITPAGVITEFIVPNGEPFSIAVGSDGNLWFTEFNDSRIGRITTTGVVTELGLLPGRSPLGIAAGSDGNLWFTEFDGNRIGRITTAGIVTEFPLPTVLSHPTSIAAGPDGNLWFTETEGNKIGRITTAGTITEFPVPTAGSGPTGIVTGPDGALWFTEFNSNKIGRITTAGTITEFPVPTAGTLPQEITAGPDGNLWFTENSGNRIGRIVPPPPSNLLLAAVLPSSRSVQVSSFATAFASIFNNSGTTINGCGIAPVTSVPADFSFQTTNPATNTLSGTPNTRVSIAPGAAQTFLMSFKVNAPVVSTEMQLGYDCIVAGSGAASSIVGVNTLLLTFDANPVADMIAVGLTPTNDGFSRIGGVGGTGIFVIAATNIGVSRSLTARARLLDSSTQATTTVCETNPSGPQIGQCKAPPSASVTRTINNNENTTWTAFIAATGATPADPAKHRVIFQFEDGPAIRGSTSTALTTQ